VREDKDADVDPEYRNTPDGFAYTNSFARFDAIDISTFHQRRVGDGKPSVGAGEYKRHSCSIEHD